MGGMLGDKGLSLADTCLASTLPLTIVARKQFFTEISVVVQFYPWFKFFFVFFCFQVLRCMIMNLKQRKCIIDTKFH